MSIFTTPVFYYGFTITTNDIYINFDEGIGQLTALVPAGRYSFESLAITIASALNSIGGQEYTCVTNRETRRYTISAPSNFDLLFGTGDNAGLSIRSVIGFNNTDKTGSNSYSSDFSAGSEFIPQFPLQNFVAPEDFTEFASANVNESGSGLVETYSIGTRRFFEFNMRPITNNKLRNYNNQSAVEQARAFLNYCITKGELEIMRDKDSRNSFETILLERSSTSSTGTGFRLNELYGNGLTGFFESGLLRFREVN